jgi:hypothetical protein
MVWRRGHYSERRAACPAEKGWANPENVKRRSDRADKSWMTQSAEENSALRSVGICGTAICSDAHPSRDPPEKPTQHSANCIIHISPSWQERP